MKFFYGVILIAGLCQCASAQIRSDGSTTDVSVFGNSFYDPIYELQTRKDVNDLSSKAATFESLGGTNRFFSADWVAGGAVTSQNKIVRADMYKYNYDYLTHQFYAKLGDTIIAVNLDHLKLFFMTDGAKTHTFCKLPAIAPNDFGELLSADTAAGKLKFIKQRAITVVKYAGANANSAFSGNTNDIYQDVINYFILFPDNTAVKIKLNSKSLMESLKPEYQARAKQLLHGSNKINEVSLAKLINDMNAN